MIQVDKRYAWLKKKLIKFEEKNGAIFPAHWDLSQRVAIQFCHQTRQELLKVMGKRRQEIDVKLLLSAIQKTSSFENLLFLRFGGHSIEESQDRGNPFLSSSSSSHEDERNPFLSHNSSGPSSSSNPPVSNQLPKETPKKIPNKFNRIITQCFDPFLYIYVESQDK